MIPDDKVLEKVNDMKNKKYVTNLGLGIAIGIKPDGTIEDNNNFEKELKKREIIR